MKKSCKFGLLLLFSLSSSLIFTLSACTSTPDSPQVVNLHTSWAQYYTSLKDLKQHSDLAVGGTIATIAPAVKSTNGLVYSMVTLKVEQIIWSQPKKITPTAITFEQTGGIYKNITYQAPEDPPFHTGNKAILFFQEYSPHKYRVSGGPTGRFSIQDGVVHPIVSDGVQLPTSTNLSTFAATLRSA